MLLDSRQAWLYVRLLGRVLCVSDVDNWVHVVDRGKRVARTVVESSVGISDERPALKAHLDQMIELWPMPHAKSRRFRKTARRTESSDLSDREAGAKTEHGTPSLLLRTTQTVCNGSAERLLLVPRRLAKYCCGIC